MKTKYDWDSLRKEFTDGNISLRALAKKHNISYQTLCRHARDGNWKSLRDGKTEKEIKSVEMDIADKLLGVLDEAINDEKQFYRYIVKEKTGSDSGEEERIFGKMDMQAFNNAIKALDSLQEIKRVMQGILSPAEERKLLLSETKTGEQGEENETGVIILPEVEDE